MMMDFPRDTRVYTTRRGLQLCGDSAELLACLPDQSVDLVLTSPPFALLRKKTYGNEEQDQYVEWLGRFGAAAYRVLKESGSFVLDLGGAYQRGKPVRSLYNYRVLLDFCDRLGYELAEEFFWFNPAKLPSPIEWVNKRKIRAKDAVNTVWWFSRCAEPKADVTRVLAPYSERMKTLLKDPERFYRPKERSSGHDIAKAFGKENGGAIPSNLLQIPNTESNSAYLRLCKMLGRDSHPARFPSALPQFFIKFLTDPGDIVLDIFSGSNTTGQAAEQLSRRWLSMELDREYAALSAVRFMNRWSDDDVRRAIARLDAGEVVEIDDASLPIDVQRATSDVPEAGVTLSHDEAGPPARLTPMWQFPRHERGPSGDAAQTSPTPLRQLRGVHRLDDPRKYPSCFLDSQHRLGKWRRRNKNLVRSQVARLPDCAREFLKDPINACTQLPTRRFVVQSFHGKRALAL